LKRWKGCVGGPRDVAAEPQDVASQIVGAFVCTLDVGHQDFCVDTERTAVAMMLQTSGFFADFRRPRDSCTSVLASRRCLEECSPTDLREVARQQCSAGPYTLRRNACGYPGQTVQDRTASIDSDTVVRNGKLSSRWRLDGRPEEDSFVEWSTIKDLHMQASHVRHWRRLPSGEPSRSVVLRRTPKPGDGAALLLIVGDHFMLVEELPKPVPRAGSSPCAPGEPPCVAACALYGRVSDKWEVKVASLPWLEGARLFGGEDGLRRVTSVTSETVGILEADGGGELGLGTDHWKILESSVKEQELAQLLAFEMEAQSREQSPRTPVKRSCSAQSPIVA